MSVIVISMCPFLDVSDLLPPEPLERALEALACLPQDEFLCLQHRREPTLLYPMLEQNGYSYLTRQGRSKPFEVFIWKSDSQLAEQAARACP